MKIPILNIYYLLCYAWDKLAERDVISVDPLDWNSLPDLFARVLVNGTSHLIRRGFDRGYIPQQERTSRIRGKIVFQEAVRRNAITTGRLPCEFDELSHDALHNRILKATMLRLSRTENLDSELAESLTHLCRRLSDVADIDLNSRRFGNSGTPRIS